VDVVFRRLAARVGGGAQLSLVAAISTAECVAAKLRHHCRLSGGLKLLPRGYGGGGGVCAKSRAMWQLSALQRAQQVC
jgi:hypothetical protein